MTNYIIIMGGVISSVGKGIITSSIGKLIETQGFSVTAMKIDPYINLDAGTMRPTEHGEVFVTQDGFETDQDLGNYERFIDGCKTTRLHSITTGQIYSQVIDSERKGEFNGKCVEVIPHIPLEVMRRIRLVAQDSKADFVLVEIGGSVGEYQIFPFVDAIRRMKFEKENIITCLVGYLPIPESVGEQKSKPLQEAVNTLRMQGIIPDFVIGRSKVAMDGARIKKIAYNCSIEEKNIISAPDVPSIYEVPLILKAQELDIKILNKFGLQYSRHSEALFKEWEDRVHDLKNPNKEIVVGIAGKYFDSGDFKLEDSYISVIQSAFHAAALHKVKVNFLWIDSKEFEDGDSQKLSQRLSKVDGLIVPGGFGQSGIQGKINAIEYIRKNKIPFLGLCYGFQCAVIEYARNVCKLTDANTTEITKSTHNPVIDIIEDQKAKLESKQFGASMRLGEYEANLIPSSLVSRMYKSIKVSERHRHRYEVNPEYIEILEKNGLIFSGRSPDGMLMEYLELPQKTHPFFIGTQSHPEFKSKFLRPNPLFDGFIKACMAFKHS